MSKTGSIFNAGYARSSLLSRTTSSYGLQSTSTPALFEYQLPVLIWLMTTFFFSTDVFSANQTSKIIVPALRFFFPTLSHAQIDFWHIFIRKCGHVSEYLFLTMLAFRAFKYEEIDPPQTAKRKRARSVSAAARNLKRSAQPQELFRTMMFVLMA